MRILSVQVPDFRALKNVDLSFDAMLEPQVFPIGSNNGGGKSTLLQLIFLLLRSGTDSSLAKDLEWVAKEHNNKMLATIRVDNNSTVYDVAFPNGETKEGTTVKITRIEGSMHMPLSTSDAKDVIDAIAQNVFLLSPGNQPYLWNQPNNSGLLIQPDARQPEDHFMAYEGLTIDYLLESFRYTRDADFVQQRDHGTYGENFPAMLADLQQLLPGKKVQPNDDFTDVKVILPGDVEIGLGDLSRGELQRLTLYAFFKRTLPASPVVLMDEVEGSSHRDWQEGIVQDLTTWAPDAQFILATHSHEICESLTPAHIIDLQPST